jgi:hypothetical protein
LDSFDLTRPSAKVWESHLDHPRNRSETRCFMVTLLREGNFRQYWPFSRQCVPVRQTEARRTRGENSFGSANRGEFEASLWRSVLCR